MDFDQRRRLVERAQGGDADAWEDLHREAYPRLRVYAASHGGYDIAEDLVSGIEAPINRGPARHRRRQSAWRVRRRHRSQLSPTSSSQC